LNISSFDGLPDETRIWIYAAERKLTPSETTLLEKRMSSFIVDWTAHKRELRASWAFVYNQFVIVAVDESLMTASGCSIDSMTRNLVAFEAQIGCKLVGTGMQIFYRTEEGGVKNLPRLAFKSQVEQKKVTGDTIVFDNTIQTLGALKVGQWETIFQNSWHSEAFSAQL